MFRVGIKLKMIISLQKLNSVEIRKRAILGNCKKYIKLPTQQRYTDDVAKNPIFRVNRPLVYGLI